MCPFIALISCVAQSFYLCAMCSEVRIVYSTLPQLGTWLSVNGSLWKHRACLVRAFHGIRYAHDVCDHQLRRRTTHTTQPRHYVLLLVIRAASLPLTRRVIPGRNPHRYPVYLSPLFGTRFSLVVEQYPRLLPSFHSLSFPTP